MKVFHYSDHSDENIEEHLNQAEVIFTTGDLSMFDLQPLESFIGKKQIFGVYGNHCVPGYMDQYGIENMHLKIMQLGQYKIGGFQGCLKYKDRGDFQFTEDEADKLLDQFGSVDILLLHAAPWGLLDTPTDPVHTGSVAVRRYVDRVKPKYVFCGHDSPSLELDYNGTKIYRTDGGRIIDIE